MTGIKLTDEEIAKAEATVKNSIDADPVTGRLLKGLWEKVKFWIPGETRQWWPFELQEHGVYKYEVEDEPETDTSESIDVSEGRKKGKKKKVYRRQPVCAPLEVIAHCRHEHNKSWGKVLHWHDRDHHEHKFVVPESMLVAPGNEIIQILADGGLRICEGRGLDVKAYVRAVETRARMRSVPRTGWFTKPNDELVFVTPDRVIGESNAAEGVIFQSDSFDDDDRMVQKGSLADWQSHVARYCIGNNLLTFAASASFAAPVMRLLGEHSGGFHLVSQSSKGKTTTLEIGASVWGHKKGTWDITKNQLENVLECHNDVLLTLDELKLVDPHYAGETVYMISNDGGKGRMNKDSSSQRKREWRVLFLSTGEISLAQHALEAGKNLQGGVDVRMVELDADAGAGMGSFESIHEFDLPHKFADYLTKEATQRYRGVAGPIWIEWLIAKGNGALTDLKTVRDDFVKKMVPPEATGEVARVAIQFGIVAAAGELASAAGITGWKNGSAQLAAEWCFQRWLASRSSVKVSSDIDKSIRAIRLWLFANRSRFESLDGIDGRNIQQLAGYTKTGADGVLEYLIHPDVFTAETCKNYRPRAVLDELDRRGYLRRGEDRVQVQQKVDGENQRFYAIRSSIMEGEDQ